MKNSEQVVATQWQLMENPKKGATGREASRIKQDEEEGESQRRGGVFEAESNSPGKKTTLNK